MDTNEIPSNESDDLRYELKKLKMELDRSNVEKADAAEFGLVILEEKNMLRSKLEQKENALESLKAQLACAQEALTAMQYHNKALEEADIAEEEKRIIQDDRVRKDIENLETELKNYKKQLVQNVEEKEKLEDLLRHHHIHNDKLKIQIQKLKEDMKDYEFRESSALKNYDILESDNVELQQQVSHLLKTVQQLETFKPENRKLAEKNEELLNELEGCRILRLKMENNLKETNEMLREEREMRMTYKRELDARILSEEGSCLDASTVASLHSFLGGPSSMVGDFSIDNISALLDGFIVHNDENDDDDVEKEVCDDDNKSNNEVIRSYENDTRLKDSLEDISCDNLHRNNKNNNNDIQMKKHVKTKKKKSKDLMSELMVTHEDYVASIEKLEIDNFRLNKLVDELNLALGSVSCQHVELKDSNFISNDEPKRDLPMRSFASTQTEVEGDYHSEDDEEKMENALRCLHGVRRYLLDMVSEAQSTYTTLCNAADESLNSKAMKHVDARKSSIEAKISRFFDNNNSDRRIPSFMLSGSFHDLHKKLKRACEDADTPEAEKDSLAGIEVDCTKLLASSIDLMRYSRRVANRMLDCKMAAKMRESSSSSPISSFTTSVSNSGFPTSHHHQQHHSTAHQHAPLTASSSFELQEQVFQLQSLMSAKSEQMTSLRQMLSANKTVYESSIEKLKHQYESEMDAKIQMIEDLKKIIDEMKENEGTKFVSEQSLIKKCDNFSCQMNDLNERLSASELERKTLNSLLRIAIQHKLILLKKLQNHGIPVDLSSNQDSREQSPSQSEPKRTSCPSPRPPIGTRFQHFHVPKQASFTPLLYSPSKNK